MRPAILDDLSDVRKYFSQPIRDPHRPPEPIRLKGRVYKSTAVRMNGSQSDTEYVRELISSCMQASTRAYCPYSRFPVGAAVLTEEGSVVTGCNVENASYGLTTCAERTAVQTAVAQGHRRFRAIAVTCDVKGSFVGPCGACRQVLMEFGPDWDVYLVQPDSSYLKTRLQELLPLAFTPAHLKS